MKKIILILFGVLILVWLASETSPIRVAIAKRQLFNLPFISSLDADCTFKKASREPSPSYLSCISQKKYTESDAKKEVARLNTLISQGLPKTMSFEAQYYYWDPGSTTTFPILVLIFAR